MTSTDDRPRMVVAVDGGPASAAALRWAERHLASRPVRVDLVTVIGEGDRQRWPAAMLTLQSAAADLRAGLPGTVVEPRVLWGDPREQLVAAAAGAVFLVIGTNRSRTSRSRGASVPTRVAATSTVTTVVVPSGWVARPGPVIAATARDDVVEVAISFAVDEAGAMDADVVLAHVWSLPNVGAVPYQAEPGDPIGSIPQGQARTLAGMAATLRARVPAGVSVTTALRPGKAVRELVDTACETEAQLIVVGRRSRSAMVRRVFGSVSRGILLTPPCPVAVVVDSGRVDPVHDEHRAVGVLGAGGAD